MNIRFYWDIWNAGIFKRWMQSFWGWIGMSSDPVCCWSCAEARVANTDVFCQIVVSDAVKQWTLSQTNRIHRFIEYSTWQCDFSMRGLSLIVNTGYRHELHICSLFFLSTNLFYCVPRQKRTKNRSTVTLVLITYLEYAYKADTWIFELVHIVLIPAKTMRTKFKIRLDIIAGSSRIIDKLISIYLFPYDDNV